MNKNILQQEVQNYIHKKSEEKPDIAELILSRSPFDEISSQELAQQIGGKIKAKNKLPTWYITSGIYYPPNSNLEQTSSERTARYKSSLVSGALLIDLTGGFGVDDYYFSKKVEKVVHCELNIDLSKIAKHNFEALKTKNITTKIGNGLEVLKEFDAVDWIYIDPSRRSESKGKVFFLEDCLPNVPEHLDFLFSKSNQILIKTSPLLDISAGIRALHNVEEIHIVAIQNEVKELLWILRRNTEKSITIHTTNSRKDAFDTFSFSLIKEAETTPEFSLPKKYIYEPNAAIMKSGGFYSISNILNVQKLHPHTHLYTSDILIDFPGRIFEVMQTLPFSRKALHKTKIKKANITKRNFPNSVSEIRKKLKIDEGGNVYLFFTTNIKNEKIIIICKKKDIT